MKKRMLSLVLTLVLTLSLVPGTVFAATVVDSGYCGGKQRIVGSHNGVVDYYHNTADRRFPGRRCVFIQKNRGLAFL